MLCCLIDRKRQLKIGARVVGYLNRLLDYITRNSENESIVDDTERGDFAETQPSPKSETKWLKHRETPSQIALRQFATLFGFLSRIVFIAIFISYFYFGEGYFLIIVPLFSMFSLLGVLLAFKTKDWRVFMVTISTEIVSALALFIIGLFLLGEILSGGYHDSSILLRYFELRDTRPICIILLIYSPMQMTFLYVIYQGYRGHPLFPDFKPATNDKSTRRAMFCYKSQKYLILIVILLLLILWAVLTSRLCGKPCPQGDNFFMNAKFDHRRDDIPKYYRDKLDEELKIEDPKFTFNSEEAHF